VTVHLNFCGRQRWAGFGIGLWRSQAIVVGVQNSDLKLDDLYLDRHTEELTEACVLLAFLQIIVVLAAFVHQTKVFGHEAKVN